MRAVLWLLLLGNLGYLGWNIHQIVNRETPVPAVSSRGMVERLTLVEEESPATPGAAGVEAREPAEAAPKALPEPAASTPQATPEEMAPVVIPAEPEEPPAPVSAPPSPVETAAEGPGEAAVPPTVTAAEEPAVEGPAAAAVNEREPKPPAVAAAPPQRCALLGPLSPEIDVAAMIEVLEDDGIVVVRETRREERPYRYWIYLPKFPDIAAAREALDRLRDAEVTDFIRVMTGPNTNAISLGLYSRERSAKNRVEELEARGFEPELEVRYETVEEIWLRLNLAEGQRLPATRLEAITGADLPEATACP